MDEAWEALRFQPWQSAPDVSFWQKLAALKLNKFQLSDQAQEIVGYFSPGRSPTVPARFTVDDSAFVSHTRDAAVDRARYEWMAHGVLFNTNTLEDFKALDKQALLDKAATRITGLLTGEGDSVNALNSFVLVTFADLKKHSFLYWFGFPALVLPSAVVVRPPAPVSSALSIADQADAMRQLMALSPTTNDEAATPQGMFPAFFVIEKSAPTGVHVQDFASWRKRSESGGVIERLFGFVDPCALPSNPGWPLRNYLALLASLPDDRLPRSQSIKVLSFREHVRHGAAPEANEEWAWNASRVFEIKIGADFDSIGGAPLKVVGWESNARGKPGPRQMDLGAILDPVRLAEQSVDLNLKLMLWRQLPSLQLDKLASTKCLVLGAGTLGCFTARSLLSWGFRNITLVDNSVVSHSNPVRQPLFEFQDVGKPKAESAASALKRIFPLVNARAVQLSIPMAGHPLSNDHLVQDASSALEQLTELITSHDVVFLGTDSRESRWLPTVICAAQQKLLINSALGFDSYLVLRHGAGATTASSLGCYFCNDIVSPRDSMKDRTLDQMCTVTRPGLAPIAASTAVELLVAVLHSPDGVHSSPEKPSDPSVPLSYIPHQLRGYLNSFATMAITGEAFDKCIACSKPVLAAYNESPFALLQSACNSTAYLEELTGLNTLAQAADAFLDELDEELSGEDDF